MYLLPGAVPAGLTTTPAIWRIFTGSTAPTGAANVNATTTNDVMVLFVEGESTNTTAQLHGTSSGSSYATFSQGDWVTGTPYPIIDTNAAATTAFNTAYNIGYFPTVYMICRDHLIQEVGQLTTTQLYAMSQQICPTYAPSGTIDAKAVAYSGKTYFTCSASPTVKFQNYSTTQSITSAVIKVYSGATTVATYNWTGNLAPFAVGSATIPNFTPNQFAPYKFDVTVTGDSYAANNVSTDSLFKVYSATNGLTTPWSENFEASADLPYRMTASDDENIDVFQSNSSYTVKGHDGATTRAAYVYFPGMTSGSTTELILGNFNTGTAANVALDFDVAYAQATASSKDKLEVKASADCGVTWTSVWSKSGTDLATTTPVNTSTAAFLPSNAGQWRHESALLTAYKGANMMVKMVGTSNAGNYAWLDNFKITNTLGVNSSVIAANSVSLYPNPARESASLDFSLAKSGKVFVSVTDAVGRTVAVAADAMMQQGAQHLTISTANLSAGVYNIAIQTEEGTVTQHLSVVK